MGGRLFVRVHGLCKSETRLKGSKQFDYYFIIFIFYMYYSFLKEVARLPLWSVEFTILHQ